MTCEIFPTGREAGVASVAGAAVGLVPAGAETGVDALNALVERRCIATAAAGRLDRGISRAPREAKRPAEVAALSMLKRSAFTGSKATIQNRIQRQSDV